jgi:hypothetical protein
MDPVYDQVFNNLYEFRSNRDDPNRPETFETERVPPDEAARAVRDTIDEADRGLGALEGLRLRSDARYFLLVNLTEMVVRPVQLRTGEQPFAGPSAELESVLLGDVKLLVSDAARRHMDRQASLARVRPPDREISGHSVVEALAANWTRLKLNSYRIWGEQ